MAITPGGRSLDSHKIDVAYTAYLTAFQNRLQTVPSIYQRLASVVETDVEVTTQIWLSSIPAMREWSSGPKHLKKFRGQSHTIRTKPYESSILVPKADIQNDKFGLYAGRVRQMANAYPAALDKLVVDFLVAGVTGTTLGSSYDGQNMIDTDHKIATGAANQSNQVLGALSATTFATAFERFMNLQDDEGRPLNRVPQTLVVGPANRTVARKIIGQKTMASGEENIDAGIVDLIVTPYITDTKWFLFVADPAAVVLQIKKPPEWLAVDDPNDSFVFDTGMFKYGIEAEFGASYGLWEDVVGGPGT